MRIVFAATILLLVACSPPAATIEATATEDATPWTGLAANDDAENFHFVIVGDRTGGARPGVFESAMPKVNLLEPAFVVSVGDLIEGYTENQAQLDREWDEFEEIVSRLQAPFFYVAGNHDMNNAVMAETWRARFGPSYYRFVYKDVLFLVLNSELFGMVSEPRAPVPGPWTQSEQLAFVEQTLHEFPDLRWTIVLIHQPLWDYREGVRGDWSKVEAMLGERNYTVFAGHFHRYVKHVRNHRKYFTLATTGGGSSLRGGIYGEFDHVAWITMTADGPRLANLMLDGIHDENLVTAASRTAVRTLADAVRPEPFMGTGSRFQRGVSTFQLANSGTATMRVAFNVDPGPDLLYRGRPETRVLAPGASERIEIPLTADQPRPWHAIAPGRVVWSLSTVAADDRPVALETTSALLPVAPLPLPVGVAPVVDADLGDWSALPFRVDRQGDIAATATTPTDISYAFGVRESNGEVYFAAKVIDDSLVASTALGPRTQDAFLIVVDARPDPERSENVPLYPATRDGHLARMAVAYLTLAAAADDPEMDFLAASSAAVEWKTARTETGYAVEAKVSGTFLDAQAGGRWDAVRIGIAAVDWDAGDLDNRIPWHTKGSAGIALHWQPDRFGTAPVPGSGTFLRMREDKL